MSKKTITKEPIERIEADASKGLTEDQVKERIEKGYVNTTSKTYNGNQQTASSITVTLNNSTLTNGTDYDITANAGGTNAGDYTVTVTGKGSYAGTASGTFTISKNSITPEISISGWTYGSVRTSSCSPRPRPTCRSSSRWVIRTSGASISKAPGHGGPSPTTAMPMRSYTAAWNCVAGLAAAIAITPSTAGTSAWVLAAAMATWSGSQKVIRPRCSQALSTSVGSAVSGDVSSGRLIWVLAWATPTSPGAATMDRPSFPSVMRRSTTTT